MRLEELINQTKSFSETDYTLLEYIMASKGKVVKMNTSQLAAETFTSPASVTRLSKKLGFSGYNEFKYFLKSELKEQEFIDNTSWELLENDIYKTVNIVSETNFLPFSELIAKSKRIFVFGTDWGERNATEYLIRNFLTVGIYMVFVPSITELKWIAETTGSDDLVIIISFSGQSKDVTEISQILRLKQTTILSVTPLTKNYLANMTPYNLYYHTSELRTLRQKNQADYNFFTTLHILLDALYRNYFDNFYIENHLPH